VNLKKPPRKLSISFLRLMEETAKLLEALSPNDFRRCFETW
jgi:hypothetical protein